MFMLTFIKLSAAVYELSTVH